MDKWKDNGNVVRSVGAGTTFAITMTPPGIRRLMPGVSVCPFRCVI